MKIGLDIMGGDYAPEASIAGAISAQKEIGTANEIVLIGDETAGKEICRKYDYDPSAFTWIHTDQVIETGEFPAKAYSKKPSSSIATGYGLLAKKDIDVFASAGNTGALMVGAMYTIKPVSGIIRPAISAVLPRPNSNSGLILDVGLNPDSKPDVLYQYGLLGSVYGKRILNIDNPRVALLNIGEEEEKGNTNVRAAYEGMKGSADFNFVGNVEGNQLFTDKQTDIVVCDGFVGNIVLKEAESLYGLFNPGHYDNEFLESFDFEKIGGTPILGVNSNVVIGHGVSNEKAVKSMINHAINISQANLSDRFKEIFTKWEK